MYARPIVEDQLLDFGVSGKLLWNALIMYDRQTDSLWSQLLGEAVSGPLTGTRLEALPSVQSTWAAWRELHPDTLALVTREGGVRDSYAQYYPSEIRGVMPEARRDERLAGKDLVLGAVVEGQAVAYPVQALAASGPANDELNGLPVLAYHEPRARASLLFDRRLDGSALSFRLDPEDPEGRTLIDDQTGSHWSAWLGAAFDGELAGRRLEQLPATHVFWFGWKDFHPETLVWSP